MRICYLSDANSVHTKKWCSFFNSLGYEIHVISLNPGEIPGVKVHNLNIRLENVRKENIANKLGYLKLVGKVKSLVKEINPDILHAHYATSYGFLGSVTNFHPYIISVWGSDIYDFPKKNIICRKFLERNLLKADTVLSTSKDMAIETKKYTNKHIEITPFGVNIDVYKPFNEKLSNNKKVIIGTVKTLDSKYGIEYLIKAFGNLSNKYDDIQLEIAGIGPQEEYLKDLCKELKITSKVKFLGFINEEKVIEAFNRFDIAAFPSNFESFGVAAVEAQACGTATIVSDAGGLPEATSPNNSSVVIEKGNVEQLEDAMEKLIKDKELRVSMGKFGRQFVLDNYNILNNLNKVNDIYISLLKK